MSCWATGNFTYVFPVGGTTLGIFAMLGELRVEDFGVGEVSKPLRSLAETCAGNANFFPWAPNVEVGVRYILLGDSIPTGEDARLEN